MIKYTDKFNQEIKLGEKIGKGGEATVYELQGKSGLVAKIYNDEHLIDKQKLKKLERMCELYDKKIAKYYAWPQEIIYCENKPVGFVMENINNPSKNQDGSEYNKFINFYASKARQKFFPQAEYRFMVHSAINLTIAIQILHRKGIVIGDINESNVCINNLDTTVKLIDCDSYQIEDYLCDVGTLLYTAPELPNKLRGLKRTENNDNFALAVMIFMILVGQHPYFRAGITMDNLRQSVIDGMFPYGENAKNKNIEAQFPYSNIYDSLSDEIKELFEKAFCTLNRPSANDWILALENFENQLVQCGSHKGHWHNSDNKACIWCELEHDGFYAFGNNPKRTKKIQHNYNIRTQNQTTYTSSINNTQPNFTLAGQTSNYIQQTPQMNQPLKYFLIISFVILFSVAASLISSDNYVSDNAYENNQEFLQGGVQKVER